MESVLSIVILISFIALILGLIKPSLVIRWKEQSTRKDVLKVYGSIVLIIIISLAVIVEPKEKVIKTEVIKQEKSASNISMIFEDRFYINEKEIPAIAIILNTEDNGEITFKIRKDNFIESYTYKGGRGVKNYDDIYVKEIYVNGKWNGEHYDYTPTLEKCEFNLQIEEFDKEEKFIKIKFNVSFASKQTDGSLSYKEINENTFTIKDKDYTELINLLNK